MRGSYRDLRALAFVRRANRALLSDLISWRWWLALWPYAFWGALVFLAGFTFGAQWVVDLVVSGGVCWAR